MENYKMVEGQLYQRVDVDSIQRVLDNAIRLVKPINAGIDTCTAQIMTYQDQVEKYKAEKARIAAQIPFSVDIIKAIDPEKAKILGL